MFKPETMELLGSNKNNLTKDKDSENIPHLETTKAVLVHCNIVNMIQESCMHLSQMNYLVNCQKFQLKIVYL